MKEYKEMVERCCHGYTQNPETGKCAPICLHSCVFGTCTAPNKCTCYNGYEPKQDKQNV